MKLPYAEDVDYWRSGTKRTPAQWIELTISQIRDHGGKNIVNATGEIDGREGFMVQFSLDGDRYKIIWPVLPTRNNYQDSASAARRQGATTLYHDVKARLVTAARYGNEFAFFQFRELPDGRTVGELAAPELTDSLPQLLRGAASGGPYMLPAAESSG